MSNNETVIARHTSVKPTPSIEDAEFDAMDLECCHVQTTVLFLIGDDDQDLDAMSARALGL